MKQKKKLPQILFQSAMTLITTLFILSLAVVLTLNFKPLYYLDMQYLDIPSTSGYSAADIRSNYNTLIDYNNIWGAQTLDFPTLTMSESGRIHFEEVKAIFITIEWLCIISAVVLLAFIIFCPRRKKDWRFLKFSGIATVGIPVLLALIISLNWERSFVIFHQIFFNNDYWIFDAATDPVITILPDTFFFHCAIMILGLVVIGSIVCFILCRKLCSKPII